MAAIAHVQDNGTANTAAASVIVPVHSTTKIGNTLFGAFSLYNGVTVESVTDTTGNRWMRCADATYSTYGLVSPPPNSSAASVGAELWVARGIQGGACSVTAICTGSGFSLNVSEFSGVWGQSPTDTWSQTNGLGSTLFAPAVSPRTDGDLMICVGTTNASVNAFAPMNGTRMAFNGGNGNACAYTILSGSVANATSWAMGGASPFAALTATFLSADRQPGGIGVNALMAFPEVMVQVCESPNFLDPINGIGTWTDVTEYVRDMDITGPGRAHELDRIQATTVEFTMNGRDGTFNPWNTESFLYPEGLNPMSPIKVTAAWDGVTEPVAYAYAQSFTPQIQDVLNVDVKVQGYDIFQMISLKYLETDNYAQQVMFDGLNSLQAYYRLGDMPGSFSVSDFSGNGQTGSLLGGAAGAPAFGGTGAFLSDANTSMDLTNGTNALNGGFQTVDNTIEPPNTVSTTGGRQPDWTFRRRGCNGVPRLRLRQARRPPSPAPWSLGLTTTSWYRIPERAPFSRPWATPSLDRKYPEGRYAPARTFTNGTYYVKLLVPMGRNGHAGYRLCGCHGRNGINPLLGTGCVPRGGCPRRHHYGSVGL